MLVFAVGISMSSIVAASARDLLTGSHGNVLPLPRRQVLRGLAAVSLHVSSAERAASSSLAKLLHFGIGQQALEVAARRQRPRWNLDEDVNVILENTKALCGILQRAAHQGGNEMPPCCVLP